ncbi:sulfotransferase domain-containing protein [Pleurocapsa sp. PCC 7319]|uniref:sulfotransferase domain-containing protein n=1 Tax=Pleurocapsa sp. PCC 7319 TaxID=118161 RepID=UPI00034A5163|nr:sulfotransferase domain-containing protein [Pleurocapsa sp. PCC 7319]
MTILQAGVPKSGNYWLYNIIRNILLKTRKEHRSYIQQHPIQEQAKNWQLSFAGQSSMDFLTIEKGRCYCRISSVFREEITDIDSYIEQCSQVWTHSSLNPLTKSILPKFNKIVYVIRDPRDVAISYSKFAFTEHKLKNGSPHYEQNSETYLVNRLEEMTRQWVQHVGGYLKYQTELNIYPIFYERLLHSFDRELEKLLVYLEIELSSEAIARIKRNVAFETMKQQSPKHLRKGSSGQWQDKLSARQQERVAKVAAPMLDLLGYSLTTRNIPDLPQKIDQKVLDYAIATSERSPLDHLQRFYNFINSQRSISAKANLAKDWSFGKIKRSIKA